jgi:hypothetical protein
MMWGVTIPYDIGPDSHPSGTPFRNVFSRNRTSGGDPVAWLRAEVKADLSAARIINAGGFSPQRWDTEPPGQVNPDEIPQSRAVTDALGCDPAYICGWVQLVAYDKLNNEPDEAYGRDSGAPFALVDNGRREFEHIIRHDPRNEIARCEAELAILDEHALTWPDGEPEYESLDEPVADSRGGVHYVPVRGGVVPPYVCRTCGYDDGQPCKTVRLLASGYKHRPGYAAAFGNLPALS